MMSGYMKALELVADAVTYSECKAARREVFALFRAGEIGSRESMRFIGTLTRRLRLLRNGSGLLDEKQTRAFLRRVEADLKNPVGPVPTPKIGDGIKKILADYARKKGE